MMDSFDTETWECSQCTFINVTSANECEVCLSPNHISSLLKESCLTIKDYIRVEFIQKKKLLSKEDNIFEVLDYILIRYPVYGRDDWDIILQSLDDEWEKYVYSGLKSNGDCKLAVNQIMDNINDKVEDMIINIKEQREFRKELFVVKQKVVKSVIERFKILYYYNRDLKDEELLNKIIDCEDKSWRSKMLAFNIGYELKLKNNVSNDRIHRDIQKRAYPNLSYLVKYKNIMEAGYYLGSELIEVVGYMAVNSNGYIMDICVDPEKFHHNIATRMIQGCCQILSENDKKNLSLHVMATNIPAISLYESCGLEKNPKENVFPIWYDYRGGYLMKGNVNNILKTIEEKLGGYCNIIGGSKLDTTYDHLTTSFDI